jgi:uncharacterized protein YbaP (TraB family)
MIRNGLGCALALLLMLTANVAVAAPAMWEARDADSRIVLLGSFHILPEGTEWRTDLLDTALADAGKVYFETDVGPLGMAALTLKLLGATIMGASDPWTTGLTVEQTATLQEALAGLGMSVDDAGLLPPWVVAMQLSEPEIASGVNEFDFTQGVEYVLQWELPPERKGYFETPGEQFEFLNTGSREEQVALLFEIIGEAQTGEDDTWRVMQIWLDGDVDALVAEMGAQQDASKDLLDRLLVPRNRNWMPQIERMLAENEENLVIVGAAHLVGEDSVIDLLEEAGYTVTRIQ